MRAAVLLVTLGFLRVAAADIAEPPELGRQRDALIEKIARGQDPEGAARAFAALLDERAALDPKAAQHLPPPLAHQASERAEAALRAAREADEKSVDHDVGWRCRLSADPAQPPLVNDSMFLADWGRVARVERVALPPKNALADPETITLYEVRGQRRVHHLSGDKGPNDRALSAAVGDWVLVCENVEPPRSLDRMGIDDRSAQVPESWRPVDRGGCSFRIAGPPRIAAKRRWNPIHVTKNDLFWAIRDVKWKLGDAFVVTRAEIVADLGGGRFTVDAEQRADEKTEWVIEVPPGIHGAGLVQPGAVAWIVAGHPRFDRALKKLVLVAEDVEARYVVER